MADNEELEDSTQSLELIKPGSMVSQFEIREIIGSGSMGVVYLTHDTDLNREVALKFLSGHLYKSEKHLERFRKEAQLIAQLNHPNIITIHEVGEYQDKPFIVMEYVKSGSLRAYQSERRRPVEEILELAIQISDGLVEAHSHGIIHRDLKPSNILINERGLAKIVDFGLATILKDISASDAAIICGTARYMSPEQIRGLLFDNRADLFSFGVVLYEILAGQPPFGGDNLGETFRSILEKEPSPLTECSPAVPEELQRIVSKLLKKNRDDRYQFADELGADLRFALEAVLAGRAKYPGRNGGNVRSIAVLPFKNLSDDREQEYFCEGIADEIINALTRIKGLHVVARTSTIAFKSSMDGIHEIGRKLHVDTLLYGSVRRFANRIRVSVRLIDVASGYHKWSDSFDREIKDIFQIQDEIASNIVKAMKIFVSDDERQAISKISTSDPQAYDYFLRGRQYYHMGRRKNLLFALQMFEKATEIDSNYALAYAGVAECCAALVHLYNESRETFLSRADKFSWRAVEIDSNLAQAHASRGFALWLLNKIDGAKKEFETAMRLDPRQMHPPYYYGRASFQLGELEKAASLFEEACKYQEYHEARFFAAQAYSAMGQMNKALKAYHLALRAVEKHVELNPDDARAHTFGAVSLCRLGERTAGLEWAERALAIDPNDAGIQYNVACLFALEGNFERSIDCLEQAVIAGFANRDWVEKDPDLDPLRENPRFQALKWQT